MQILKTNGFPTTTTWKKEEKKRGMGVGTHTVHNRKNVSQTGTK